MPRVVCEHATESEITMHLYRLIMTADFIYDRISTAHRRLCKQAVRSRVKLYGDRLRGIDLWGQSQSPLTQSWRERDQIKQQMLHAT